MVQHRGEALGEGGAVGQVGQKVMVRHVGDLLFGVATLGHVLVGRHPTAARHRLMHERDGAAVAQLQYFFIRLAVRERSAQLVTIGLGAGGKVPFALRISRS